MSLDTVEHLVHSTKRIAETPGIIRSQVQHSTGASVFFLLPFFKCAEMTASALSVSANYVNLNEENLGEKSRFAAYCN